MAPLAGISIHGLLFARMKRLSLTILAAGLALAAAAQDDGALFGGATTQTRLLLAADAAKPGDEVLAGVELKMAPGREGLTEATSNVSGGWAEMI